jgi:hypothetical protein
VYEEYTAFLFPTERTGAVCRLRSTVWKRILFCDPRFFGDKVNIMKGAKVVVNKQKSNDLMERAVIAGQRGGKLPIFLMKNLKGFTWWLLRLKALGSSRALEPIYAAAEASGNLIPDILKSKIVRIRDEAKDFIRYNDFGESYGSRFKSVVDIITSCQTDKTIISLGSGSALPEITALSLMVKRNSSVPKLILVDFCKKGLKRARRFAKLCGVEKYLVCTEQAVSSDYKVPSLIKGDVVIISSGLAGNYFPERDVIELIAGLIADDRVVKICLDFIDPSLTERLKAAFCWPIAKDDDDLLGVHPRSQADVERYLNESGANNYPHKINCLAWGKIWFLEIDKNLY